MVKYIQRIPYIKTVAAQNVAVSLTFKVLTSLLFLILVPYSIRTMGAESYGIAAFFLTMHGYVSLLDSGFSYALGLKYTRAIVNDPHEAQSILSAAIPLYLFISVLALIGFFLFRFQLSRMAFASEAYAFHMGLFGVVLAVTAIDSMLVTVMQGHEKISQIVVGRFILDLVKVAGVTGMAFFKLQPDMIVWFIVASSVLKFAFDLRIFSALTKIVNSFDYKRTLEIFYLALPSIGIALCSLYMSMLDKFFVSGKISSSAFTSYSFAFDLTTKAYFLMYAITTVIYPKLIKTHSQGNSMFGLVRIQLFSLLGIVGVYYLPLFVFSDGVTRLLLGENLVEPTSTLIRFCCAIAILYLIFSIFENFLNARGAVLKTFIVYLCGLTAVSVSMGWLVEKFEIYGVPVAVLLMFSVMIAAALVASVFDVRRARRQYAKP
jgi:PST family polysaccharide transporter